MIIYALRLLPAKPYFSPKELYFFSEELRNAEERKYSADATVMYTTPFQIETEDEHVS